MKLETAVKILHNECDFLGMEMLELLGDIAKHGRIIYSAKVLQAAEVFETQYLLAQVDH
jgi:molybdenum-dependent DNA-binding transcriptional regulator ModE